MRPDPDDVAGAYTSDERLVRVELALNYTRADVRDLRTSLDGYVLKLAQRPSWAVFAMLTLMQVIIGGLTSSLVYVLATR